MILFTILALQVAWEGCKISREVTLRSEVPTKCSRAWEPQRAPSFLEAHIDSKKKENDFGMRFVDPWNLLIGHMTPLLIPDEKISKNCSNFTGATT